MPRRQDKRSRILDAAEQLWATKGFSAVSVREITAAADVNLASVHYYFGSKAALLEEVLKRRIKPINEARLQQLEQLEKSGKKIRLEELLHVFFAPVVLGLQDSTARKQVAALMIRVLTDPSPDAVRVASRLFRPVIKRFQQVLHSCLPVLRADQLGQGIVFCVGAMAFGLTATLPTELFRTSLSADSSRHPPPEELLQNLVGFCSAGLRGLAAVKNSRSAQRGGTNRKKKQRSGTSPAVLALAGENPHDPITS